jgi:long-chain acyl-CoA synthetase
MSATRIFDLVQEYLQKYGNKPDMLGAKENGRWRQYSVQEFIQTVDKVSLSLLALGIQKNDKVALISNNRPEWNFVDFGVQQLGAVSVPMYPTISEDDYRFIFQDAGVRLVFVSSEELYHKAKAAAAGNPNIDQIITFEQVNGALSFSQFLEKANSADTSLLEEYKKNVLPEDLLTLIYTSGTTGTPKGVMLTHNNLLSNVQSCFPLIPVSSESRALSFLPLCHIYERMLCYLYIRAGISIYYAESVETVGENLKEVKPHLFVTVPRLLEKVYDKIVAKGQELTGIKKALFFWALGLGQRYELNVDQGWWYRLQLKLANKLIFSKWREALGGNVKLIVSGGAALQPRLARVFSAAQIIVMEGYGLTETSPVIAVNRYEESNRAIGTVGPVIDGVEVKIAEDGEILTRGPHVMKGYYNRPDLTAETIDSDGWLHTGDIGEFVQGKFLKITDRKKEIFKTSGGKYIAPQRIENKLKESLVIEQAMVVGEGQKFPAVVISPFFQSLRDWCKIKDIPYTTDAEMIKHPKVLDKFQREVDKCNEGLGQFEKVKKFVLVPHTWSVQTGELTPTLKLKRKVLYDKYKHLILPMFE